VKGAIIFASYVPSLDKLRIGKEFLDKFVELFSDYDIYIGVSDNSCEEWYKMLGFYSKKLNITYKEVPKELDSGYGVIGTYQTALKLFRDSHKKYDICWFGHTKGVTSNMDDFRAEVFRNFWDMKPTIETKILKEGYSIYSPYITLTAHNWLNTTLPTILEGVDNDNLCSLYSFWVHSGEVINYFIENCNQDFFTKNILTFKRLNGDGCIDRYFFERDFPMIYQKMGFSKKLLYVSLDDSHKRMLGGKTIDEITNNNIVKL